MVKQDIIERKLGQIEKSMRKIRQYKVLSYAEFISHSVARDIVEYNLFIIINCMIDTANHIVADDDLGQVDMLADGFRILKDVGYWTEAECQVYIKMVAFRNMISHQYMSIDGNIVYDILQNRLEDIMLFRQHIMDNM
ncbi:type VII toxin-antitoxin system HepT family RNase toxin [Sporomusa termitida]|uniref:DUF86 domain-containing protein n=1 Tax=Sporomusa termitida TaxID=2377 RepID=A0A517DXN5_9FIRM|nr:DUF86 domain-containing protein [Sporomusa termitida]QDR82006.1 hypothetical protein SPTER_34270 [Sporomusa termitida]